MRKDAGFEVMDHIAVTYAADEKLSHVFELNVFCPVYMEGENDWVVAYLMNDAVESFLVFKDSVMTGKYIDVDEEQIPSVQMLKDGYMLIDVYKRQASCFFLSYMQYVK